MIGAPLLCLVVAEFALRVATTKTLYFTESNPHYIDREGMMKLKPNLEVWWYGCHYQINSNGFRMPHEVGPKRGYRILAIGDSVTLGMGVRDTEDVWPSRLEILLRQRGYDSTEVINSAVQGWNLMKYDSDGNLAPAEFTRFVEETAPKLSPDIVLYCICLNDVPSRVEELFSMDNAGNKARFRFFPESYREWLKRKAVYRLARDAFRESRFRKLDFSGILTASQPPKFWEQVSSELKRLKKAAQAHNAKLCCIIVPYSYQLLPANHELLTINRLWHEVLDKNEILWNDLTPVFNADNVLQYYSLGDYIHLNKKGHALIAERAMSLIEHELTEYDERRNSPASNTRK